MNLPQHVRAKSFEKYLTKYDDQGCITPVNKKTIFIAPFNQIAGP